ncbi:hypothetical protein H0H93_007573 [Arthromyces matolae]|nr:hypothetical protein H0H93_007573 [Arthromyces matolae]
MRVSLEPLPLPPPPFLSSTDSAGRNAQSPFFYCSFQLTTFLYRIPSTAMKPFALVQIVTASLLFSITIVKAVPIRATADVSSNSGNRSVDSTISIVSPEIGLEVRGGPSPPPSPVNPGSDKLNAELIQTVTKLRDAQEAALDNGDDNRSELQVVLDKAPAVADIKTVLTTEVPHKTRIRLLVALPHLPEMLEGLLRECEKFESKENVSAEFKEKLKVMIKEIEEVQTLTRNQNVAPV